MTDWFANMFDKWHANNRSRHRFAILDEEVEQSIEVLAGHYFWDDMEDYLTLRKSGNYSPHVFQHKERVTYWLENRKKYKFSVRPIYLSLTMLVVALVIGYLLGLSNEALRNHGGNYECKTETCVRNQDETNTGSRIPK